MTTPGYAVLNRCRAGSILRCARNVRGRGAGCRLTKQPLGTLRYAEGAFSVRGYARPTSARLWTPEEEQRLRDAFAAQTPVSEIAAAHERTTGAITARLIRLGLIEAPRHTSYPPNNRAAPAPAATAKELEDMPF